MIYPCRCPSAPNRAFLQLSLSTHSSSLDEFLHMADTVEKASDEIIVAPRFGFRRSLLDRPHPSVLRGDDLWVHPTL
jgi:hypothetical protein